MAILFKNNAASTLSSIYISSTGKFSDLYVADSSVFPSITAGTGDYFYLTLVGDDTLEIVKAFETGTNSSGGKYIRVYRAQEDTVQQDWPAGTRVEMRITAGSLESFFSTEATETVLGVSKLSTYQQAIEGTDNTTNMTPRRTVDAIHQFNTTVVETPTVTGTTSVRSGTTYPYTFTASVMGGFEDPIVAFYYVGNQTGDEPFIRIPVESPTTTNATATGDVSFVGEVGDVIVVTTYAETELGNVSKYGTLNVSIIANNPPDISNLEDNVPSTAYAGKVETIHFSGATDEDGDTVKYRIKNAQLCTFSKTTDIADGEDITVTWQKPADYPVDATDEDDLGFSTFTLEAYDNFGGSAAKNYSVTVRYAWGHQTVITVTSGTSPEFAFTFAKPFPYDVRQFPMPNYFIGEIKYADGRPFTTIVITKEETNVWSENRTGGATLPWNNSFTMQSYWSDSEDLETATLYVRLPIVNVTTVVTTTAPTWVSEQNQTVTPDESTFAISWNSSTSTPSYEVKSFQYQVSTDVDFSSGAIVGVSGDATTYNIPTDKFEFDNPSVINYIRIRDVRKDTAANLSVFSPWSSALVVYGQTASLDPASITSPVANTVLDPSVATTVNIALGEVVGQTVDKMKVDVLEGDSDTIVHTSGEIAYSSSYVIPANTLDYNGTFRLRCNTHGTLTGWVDGNLTTVSTIMHKYTDQPVLVKPTNSAILVRVEAAQSYTWVNASAVGENTNSYTRLVIMDSSGSTVYTKDAGTNATSYSVPANTLSHNTKYTWKVINWFVTGGTAGVDDLTKSSTSNTWSFTTTPTAVSQTFRASGSYSVPYTGTYEVVAIGGGGSGGTGHTVFDSSSAPLFTVYVYAGSGGGSGGISRWQGSINSGTKLTYTVGAGGAAQTTISSDGVAGGISSVTGGSVNVSAGGGGGGKKDGYGAVDNPGGAGGSGIYSNGGAGGKSRYCDPGEAGVGVGCSGGAGYPTSACQGNSQVGNAAGGGGCSAYNGYIAGGGGAGASGDLMAVTGWATPGWANDTHTHPDNDGAGQVGAVIITSTWDL